MAAFKLSGHPPAILGDSGHHTDSPAYDGSPPLNWHPSDFRGRDVRLVFKATEKVFKRPIGRPKKLPIEILECKRSDRVWSWSDHVSALEAQAGHQFHEDWRASGLEPVQAQRLEEGDCGSQARTGSTDWAADDVEGYDPPGSTVGMPKSGAVKADESVTRTYSGSTRGTLHIIFKTKDEQNPNDQVPDAIARVERDLMRAGFGEERGGGRVIEVTYDTVPRSIPKRMSAETVARLIKEFEERTGRTDHRVAPKRRGKRKHTTLGIGNGMKPLTDPSASEQGPRDDDQGRRRIAWRLAHKALRKALGMRAALLVERTVLFGEEIVPPSTSHPGEQIELALLKDALAKLSKHYGQKDYQQKLDEHIRKEEEKAHQWLQSSSLCQPQPPLGWKTRLRSMACRSPR